MVALKAKDADRFIRKPHFEQKVVLIYGPDAGLVAERADMLAKASGVDLSDPFCVIRLDADDVASDVARLADEAHTIGMFGGKRLIRISGTTRKDLAKAVAPVLDFPPEDAIILIEAGDLKKTAGLRKKLEASKQAICLPCFQDNDAALEQLIDEEILSRGLKMDHETRQELKSMLGDNRMLSRGELAKLALYCEGKSHISQEDVRSIVGDASALVLDDVIDAVGTGNPERLQTLLPKALESGHSPDMIVYSVLRYFQTLHSARATMEKRRQPAASVIGGLRPPVYFARKEAIRKALTNWPLNRLGKALSRLDQAILDCRKQSSAAGSICSTTLLSLCLEARILENRR